MKFLVDNQLPPALAWLIRNEFGCDAVHVSDLRLHEASDELIWKHATESGLIVISKDQDFTSMALNQGAALLWVRTGNCRSAVLLNVFRLIWRRIVERLQSGDRFIEIR